MKINAIDRSGKKPLLKAATAGQSWRCCATVGCRITAECGGACACATCHIYIEDGWYEKLAPPTEAEIDMLDMALAVEPNSRLSCQITCTPELDGLTVTVAPE